MCELVVLGRWSRGFFVVRVIGVEGVCDELLYELCNERPGRAIRGQGREILLGVEFEHGRGS